MGIDPIARQMRRKHDDDFCADVIISALNAWFSIIICSVFGAGVAFFWHLTFLLFHIVIYYYKHVNALKLTEQCNNVIQTNEMNIPMETNRVTRAKKRKYKKLKRNFDHSNILHGSPINLTELMCQTAISTQNDAYATMKHLLKEKRVDANGRDNFAIRHAAECGNHQIVRLLLKYGADPTSCHNYALRYAIKNNHVSTVETLMGDRPSDLTKLVNPTIRNNEALSDAIVNNNLEIVKLLLDDPLNRITRDTLNANVHVMYVATNNRNPDIINELLGHGANLHFNKSILEDVIKSDDCKLKEIFRYNI